MLKDKFSLFLKQTQEKKTYLQKLIELLNEVKSLDMIKSYMEDLLENSDIGIKK